MAKSKTTQPQFTILLPSKPYVKHFLSVNYGSPVDLRKDRILNNNLRNRLRKHCLRHEKRGISLRMYSEKTEIIISEDDFYRYGWELSNTDIIALNRDIEAHVKLFMRNIIATYETVMLQKDAILLFQDRFGFSEDIWSYEAIKKDYWRNSPCEKIKLYPKITAEIEKIVLEHLSAHGTFALPKTNQTNENNQ